MCLNYVKWEQLEDIDVFSFLGVHFWNGISDDLKIYGDFLRCKKILKGKILDDYKKT